MQALNHKSMPRCGILAACMFVKLVLPETQRKYWLNICWKFNCFNQWHNLLCIYSYNAKIDVSLCKDKIFIRKIKSRMLSWIQAHFRLGWIFTGVLMFHNSSPRLHHLPQIIPQNHPALLMLSRFSCVQLFSYDPMNCSLQCPLSMEFSRQEYWSGLPCSPPGDLAYPRIKPT